MSAGELLAPQPTGTECAMSPHTREALADLAVWFWALVALALALILVWRLL